MAEKDITFDYYDLFQSSGGYTPTGLTSPGNDAVNQQKLRGMFPKYQNVLTLLNQMKINGNSLQYSNALITDSYSVIWKVHVQKYIYDK